MKEPTKADLAAAVARLTEENEALRDLLAAAAAYAELPHPASYVGSRTYEYELERRADAIAIWANGDREDMAPDVYVLVIQDRAKHLREEAARPVRYEVKAAPAPETCGADGSDGKGIIVCTLPPGHEGRHERHHETGVTHWPADETAPGFRPVAVEFHTDSRLTDVAPCAQPEEHDADLAGEMPGVPVLCDLAGHHLTSAANPPHHAGPREEMCLAEDAGYMCSSQKGHDGPLHVAWKVEAEGTWYHLWPVTVADAARTEHAAVAS